MDILLHSTKSNIQSNYIKLSLMISNTDVSCVYFDIAFHFYELLPTVRGSSIGTTCCTAKAADNSTDNATNNLQCLGYTISLDYTICIVLITTLIRVLGGMVLPTYFCTRMGNLVLIYDQAGKTTAEEQYKQQKWN